MDKIIDAHSHIGNNLYPHGGRIIEKKGITKKRIVDVISIFQFFLNRDFGLHNHQTKFMKKQLVASEKERNFLATRENMRKSMDDAGVDFTVCLPVSTFFVPFSDIKSAAEKDPGIIPFTGIDHTKEYDFDASFAENVAAGAKGLKLHPILQRISLTDKRTFNAVEAFAPHKLPVLFHCGITSYYFGEDEKWEKPEYGAIHYAQKLVEAFPNVNFIAGHAGAFNIDDVISMLCQYKNVWVDTSLQSPENVKKLIKTFGPERILHGSDWPFTSRRISIKIVKKACHNDQSLERKIFFENAAELLKL
jgi:hypothetical protein